MAHTDPGQCAMEKRVQVIGCTPTSGLISSCTSIECGKPDVFTGTVRSPSSWRGSMQRRSLGSGRGPPHNGKIVGDVAICVHEQARGNSPEIHLQGKLEQCEQLEQRGRSECNQGLSNKKNETPINSMDDGGVPWVEIARCTPSGGGDKSTISTFGLRGDLFTQAVASCQLCMVGRYRKKHPGSPDGCECGSTAVVIIQNPFAANKRQLLTVDTALYLGWARSSTIVNDFRQATDDKGIL